MELCPTFQTLLESLRGGFPASTSASLFPLWNTLMVGWILSHRQRFVSDLILSAGAQDAGFSRYYRFLNQKEWSLDKLFECLARLIVKKIIGEDVLIYLAVDDTVCRKKGLNLFGVGMHHDPLLSSKGMKITSWGHDWVVVSIVVFGLRWAPGIAFSLPIGFRLYRNKQGVTKGQKKEQRSAKKASTKTSGKSKAKTPEGHKTRPELAVELLTMIAAWFPKRRFVVAGDSLYGGKSVAKKLPANMDLISRTSPTAALYEPPPLSSGGPGRPRKKGERLSTISEWAADNTPWTIARFDSYGLHATLRWKRRDALYYAADSQCPLQGASHTRNIEAAADATKWLCHITG